MEGWVNLGGTGLFNTTIVRENMHYMTVSSGRKLNCFHLQLFATTVACKQTPKNTAKHKKRFMLVTFYVMWDCE